MELAVLISPNVGSVDMSEELGIQIYADDFLEIRANVVPDEGSVFKDSTSVVVVVGNTDQYGIAISLGRLSGCNQSSAIAALHGHFLIVTYQPKKRRLSIFRDKGGFCHGYYWHTNNDFAFSSSLKHVLSMSSACQKRASTISKAGLAHYLCFQYLPTPYTMFNGVFQLSPGTVLQVGPDAIPSEERYVAFPYLQDNSLLESLEIASDTIQNLLHESIQRQLDVEKRTAAFLSGGMDTSTNVAKLVNEFNVQPVLFTARFQEEQYDELAAASIVAKHFGLIHETVLIDSSLLPRLPEIVGLYPSPLGDKSVFAEYFLGGAVKEYGCSQLVTGEGGDEILGYPRSRDGKATFESLPDEPKQLADLYFQLTSVSPAHYREAMLHSLPFRPDCGEEYLMKVHKQFPQSETFERLYWGQWQTWLIDDVYMKDRQVSDHFGLKLVLPFMDTKLMEYLATLSTAAKKRGLADKFFLKHAMGKSLPEQTLKKPKQKFWLPFSEWFRAEAESYDYLRETLMKKSSFVGSQYGRGNIRAVIDEHKAGAADNSRLLWALLFLEVWFDEFAKAWL